MREHVARTGGSQLFERLGVGIPAGIHVPSIPLSHLGLVVEVIELPAADPVDRPQEHIERIRREQRRHLVHLPAVVVDLHADLDGKTGRLGLEAELDIGIEV